MVYKSYKAQDKLWGYRYATTDKTNLLSNYNGRLNTNYDVFSIKSIRPVKDKIEFLGYLKKVLYSTILNNIK